MLTPEQKLRLVRDQTTAKVKWGATRDEVAEWLAKQHGLVGDEAERVLAAAFDVRRQAIRDRAMFHLVFAASGLIAVAAFVYLRFFSGLIFSGTGATLANLGALGIAVASVMSLIRNLALVKEGETGGTVD